MEVTIPKQGVEVTLPNIWQDIYHPVFYSYLLNIQDRATLESDPSALSGFMSRVMPQVSLFFVSRFVDVKVITLLRKFKALNSGFGQSPMRRRRHYSYLFCNPVSFLIDSLNSQDPQKSSSCWYHGCEVWVSQGNWSLCWPPVTM